MGGICPICQEHVCGKNLTVEHAFTCPTGGMPTLRHNNLRDLTNRPHVWSMPKCVQSLNCSHCLRKYVLHGQSAKRQDGARVDVRRKGFWEWSQDAFIDVRVFNPFTSINCSQSHTATYQHHERENRRSYDQRICEVEHDSFIPLVFAATGGIGKAAHVTYQRLVSMLALKRDQPYSQLMNTITGLISFSLLKSQIRYIRGSRSTAGYAIKIPISVIASETRVPSTYTPMTFNYI